MGLAFLQGLFHMAEILGVPYIHICTVAAVPALLYYLALWFAIQFEAEKMGVGKVSPPIIPRFKEIMGVNRSLPLGTPVAVLLYFMIAGYTPELSCVWSVLSAGILYFVTRGSWAEVKNAGRKLVRPLESTGHSLIMIARLCTAASAIVGIVNATGIGIKFFERLFYSSLPFPEKPHESRADSTRLLRVWSGGSKRTGRDRGARYPPSLLPGGRSRNHLQHSDGCPER